MTDRIIAICQSQADVPNVNGHIYPREVLESFAKQINEHPVLVYANPPPDNLTIKEAIGVATNAAVDNDRLRVEVTLTQAHAVLVTKALASPIPVRAFSMVTGSLDDQKRVVGDPQITGVALDVGPASP